MNENTNSFVDNNPEGGPSGEKILCVAAYLLSLPGVVIARAAGKKSGFCLHHARRSLELFLFMLFLLVVWYVGGHILMLIPYAGFPIAIAVFGIVVTAFVFCGVLAIIGIAKALKGKTMNLPFISSIMGKFEGFFNKIGLSEQ